MSEIQATRRSRMKSKSGVLIALMLLGSASAGPSLAETASQRCETSVFWDTDYGGDRLVTGRNHQNLSAFGSWNDQISSIFIAAGVWEFFEHVDYAGDVLRLTPGGYNMDPKWNDRISSFRCIQPTAPLQ